MEVDKLRQRLSNIGKNVVEYRMTVSEAKTLLAECESLIKLSKEKPPEKLIVSQPAPPRLIDGGEF